MSEGSPLNSAVDLPWLKASFQQFADQLQSGKVHHALLINGPAGCGKRQLAEACCSFLLCDEPTVSGVCGACKGCRLLQAGTHPGFFSLVTSDSDDQIKVDQIRAAIDFTQHTQMKQGVRVVLITPAENMNRSASNALLKCLEEPQGNVHFILVSDNPGSLPATIRSRCQSLPIVEPDKKQAMLWLQQFEPDSDKAEFLMSLSERRPLLARFYFEQGLDAFYEEMLQALLEIRQKKIPVLEHAEPWSKNAYLLDFWYHWLMEQSRSLLLGKPIALKGVSLEALLGFIQQLLVTKKLAGSTANLNRQLLLESLLVDWRKLGNQ